MTLTTRNHLQHLVAISRSYTDVNLSILLIRKVGQIPSIYVGRSGVSRCLKTSYMGIVALALVQREASLTLPGLCQKRAVTQRWDEPRGRSRNARNCRIRPIGVFGARLFLIGWHKRAEEDRSGT